MTELTVVKGEMHCHSGFLAIFGTIKQQGVGSFRGILPLEAPRGHALDQLGGLQCPQPPAGSGNGTVGVTFFCKGSYFRNAGSYPVP